MSSDPNRDFAEQARKVMESLIEESQELDYALRRGRVGGLLRKYNPRHSMEQESKDDDGGKSDDRASDPGEGPGA